MTNIFLIFNLNNFVIIIFGLRRSIRANETFDEDADNHYVSARVIVKSKTLNFWTAFESLWSSIFFNNMMKSFF